MEKDKCLAAAIFFASVQVARSLYACDLDRNMQFPNAASPFKARTTPWSFHHAISPREPNLLEFMWCDQDQKYFIHTTYSLAEAEPIFGKQIQQVDPMPNADPTRNTLLIPQPRVSKMYYDNCG